MVTITDLVEMPLNKLANFFKQLELDDYDTMVSLSESKKGTFL